MEDKKKLKIKEIIIYVLIALEAVGMYTTISWIALAGNNPDFKLTIIQFLPMCALPLLLAFLAILYGIFVLVVWIYISYLFRKGLHLDNIPEFTDVIEQNKKIEENKRFFSRDSFLLTQCF